MTDWLLAIFAAFSFFQIGLVLDYYVLQEKRQFDLAKFWALGLGTVAVFQMVLALLGLPIGWEIVFIIAALAIVPLLADKKLRQSLVENLSFDWKILPFIVLFFLLTFSQAIWGHDAFAFWLSRGRAFFLDGAVTRNNLYFYWPFDQPILWPLVATWFYRLTGQANNYFVRVIPFVTFLLVGFRLKSWLWRAVLLLTPFMYLTLVLPESGGNADFLVGLFVFLAAGYLLDGRLLYTGIFLGLAALTKNEGVLLLLAFIVWTMLLLRREPQFKNGLVAAGSLLIFTWGFKLYFGLGTRYLRLPDRPFVPSLVYTAQALREEFRQVYRWSSGWWLSFFILVISFKKIFKNRRVLVLLLLLAGHILSLFWVYYVTPEDQPTQIATSLSRVLVQIYPAIILLCSALI